MHIITDRGNRGITAVNTAAMGGERVLIFYRGSGGNEDSYFDINIDYRGKTAVIAVAAVIVTKLCLRGGNEDDFLSPCSSLQGVTHRGHVAVLNAIDLLDPTNHRNKNNHIPTMYSAQYRTGHL